MEVVHSGERRKVSGCEVMPDTNYEAGKCHHSPLVHCVHLPDKLGIAEATVDTFHLFLRHLYFASTLRFPPITPDQRCRSAMIDDDTPICLTFPTSQPFDLTTHLDMHNYVLSNHSLSGWSFDPLLSLFHYFDCRAALTRCEEVIMSDTVKPSMRNTDKMWFCLPVAIRFGLNEAEQWCVKMLVSDSSTRTHTVEDYRSHVAQLGLPSAAEVRVTALVSNKIKTRPY